MQTLKNRSIAFILVLMITMLFIPTVSYAATSEEADDITYSVDAGDDVDFDEDDFYDAGEDFIDDGDLNYVQFDLPDDSDGILYYDNDEEVDDSDTFGEDGDEGDIDDVYFTADDDASGTVIISYEGVYDDDEEFTGEIRITVNGDDDADVIEYSVDSDDTVDFKGDDFDEVCQDVEDADLDYVNFTTLPSSSTKGTLYYNYDEDDEDSVDKTTDYSVDDLDDITFVPKDDSSGTVTISYKGYDEDGDSFTGKVEITIDEGESKSGDINYSVDADDTVDFDEDDFNDYCEDENDASLDFVTFTLPSSSKGILYYDYDGDDEEKISSSDEYYYDENPSIDDITFVPDEDYSGYCEIEFEGEDEDGDSIEGTIVISVANEDLVGDVIYLSGTAGSPILMQEVYFNKQCKEVLNDTLGYVKFTLPAASAGTLYYSYTTAAASAKVSASSKYYYDDKSPYLNKVSFVSAGTGAGTYTIKYTGYGTDDGSFTGEVKITVAAKTAGSGSGSLYYSDVKDNYAWAILYVDTLYSTGVITGGTSSDGTMRFNPGTAITRGDFMLYLSKALNLSSSIATSNFSDVPAGSYYYDAIAVAKALGIAQGSNNKFYPNSTITREDAMVLALRAMNVSGNSVGTGEISYLGRFTDSSAVSSYAKEGVATLIKNGIINGSDGKINPKYTITRAESAAMIYRIKY